MTGQFHAESFTRSTRQESGTPIGAFDSNGPVSACQFVDDFENLVGDDVEPDPLFFVECWTVGNAAAATNFRQRRQRQVDDERSSKASRNVYSSRILSFAQQCDLEAKALSAAGAAASAGRYYADWSRQYAEEFATQAQKYSSQQAERCAEPGNSRQETTVSSSMTLQRACLLLGVAATSTRGQIKTAYRQMASQWHPDRLQHSTKQERRIATDQMAAINEAYHFLRSCARQELVC
jgi:DnaJ-domain-containing protein 1